MAATKNNTSGLKRKPESDANGSDVKKKARPANASGNDVLEATSAQDRIKQLAKEVLESKKNFNNIVTLLELAKGESEAHIVSEEDEDKEEQKITASISLCAVFMHLLEAGSFAVTEKLSEKKTVVVNWLRERLSEYETLLMEQLSKSAENASTVLELCMNLLQAEGRYLRAKPEEQEPGADNFFPQLFLNSIVRNLVLARYRFRTKIGQKLAEEYVETWASEYSDVVFYTFKAVSANLKAGSEDGPEAASEKEALADGSLYLLSLIDDVPESSEEFETFFINPPPANKRHPLYSVQHHKKQAQKAWLGVLRLAATEKQRKQVLEIMATVIAPWFTVPEMLLDYITDSYNARGTSLLALSGLYYLIQKRNVDYPSFFTKLYSLLDGEILHSKHRARFFRLMDEFLASTHLPVQIVASFIKRVSRLSLNAPPSSIVIVVPWVYNMLKKHPLCTFMVHREPRTQEERERLQDEGMDDPFLPDEADPMNTNAIDSCLWELVQHQSHYHPQVATIAKMISLEFTKPSYNMEDFLCHSYQSIYEAEVRKQVKKDPTVEYSIRKHIFRLDESEAEGEGSLPSKLWDHS